MQYIAAFIGFKWIAENWRSALIGAGIVIFLFVVFRVSKKQDEIDRRKINELKIKEEQRKKDQEAKMAKAAEEADRARRMQEREQAIADAEKRIAEKEGRTITFPAEVDGVPAAYHYGKVRFSSSVDFSLEPFVGDQLYFQFSDGVAYVVHGGDIIGALDQSRICEMVDDWIHRNEPILAYFSSAYDEKREYNLAVAFYRDKFKYLIRKHPDAKKYKLIGNRSEEMQGNIGDLKEGQPLTVEYDYDKEKYAVLDGWEIGYLPASAARIVNEYGPDDVKVFVAGTEIDEELKTVVYVYVFD